MPVCILTLILSCGPGLSGHAAAMLNLAHAGIAFADTYSTQRTMDLCRTVRGCVPALAEGNPLTRPFQDRGPAVAYLSTGAGLVGTAWLAQRLRTTSGRWAWTRKVWWVPQAVLTGASVYGRSSQVALYGTLQASVK